MQSSLGVSLVGGVLFAVGNPAGKGNADSWALGTAAAFGLNFILVMIGRILVARNMRELANSSSSTAPSVVLEA